MKYIYKIIGDLNGLSPANVKVGKSVQNYGVWCQNKDLGTPGIKFGSKVKNNFCKNLEVDMTERQKEIYMVIEEWWKKFGFGPSIDDIMSITGDKSRANVHRMILRLCEEGACKRTPNRDRSVRPAWMKFRNL